MSISTPRRHERGLLEGEIRWAPQLKEEVGNAYRIVYQKPCEDPDSRLDERREVLADGALVRLPSFK